MTISYASEVPNGSSFGIFWRILFKWRGSVYKLVWRELLAYLTLYYSINLMYRYALNDEQKRIFQKIRQYFGSQSESIPLSFVLGFYVSLVVKRWWEQYKLLPWPDTLALFISAAIPGNHETGRLMRRNIMRYMVLAYVITLQRISLRVKRRFPTWQHVVDAGLMLESEKKIFDLMDCKSPMSKYWMPLIWATNIINRARKDNLITSDHIVQTLLMELSDIRRRLGALIGYDTVCVPLVYTQVVTLVLYTYFVAALLGRQMLPEGVGIDGKHEDPDLYFPLFTVFQFCFYVGWLKVAEVLINPFGEDDDDIELNWLIDRHIKASYMIVDEMHEEHPELLKDQYWEEVVPKDLPYTVASEHYRKNEPKGSAELYKVKTSEQMYANIMPSKRNVTDDVYADYESVDTPMVERRKNWFSRQITRMGSVRSSSTAYSSGGLFNRNRLNSVYSSPEAGLGHLGPSGPPSQKMSLYDKFVGRKSVRQQRQLMKQNSKISANGSVISGAPLKNRPRIPTPDVTKESIEKENRFNGVSTTTPSIATGVALMTQQLANAPSMYNPSTDLPVVGTLLLTPIKEMDSSGSGNNTLQPGHPTTAALAKAVLPKSLQAAGFGSASPSFARIAGQTSNGVRTPGSEMPISMMFPTSVATTGQVTTLPMTFQTNTSSIMVTELPADSANVVTSVASSGTIPMKFQTNAPSLMVTELPADSGDAVTSVTPTGHVSTLSMPFQANTSSVLVTELPADSTDAVTTKEVLSRMSSSMTTGSMDETTERHSMDEAKVNESAKSSSASAPSTMTKAKTDANHTEVYV